MDVRRRFLDDYKSDAFNNYLTIEALSDNLKVKLTGKSCEYCIDESGDWQTLSSGTYTQSIKSGHKFHFRGNLTPSQTSSLKGIGTFTISGPCNLSGNCMSMLFGDNAGSNLSLNGYDYAFHSLFKNCSTIEEVSDDFLPAKTLSTYCYYNMFYFCTNLIKTPLLPSMTMKDYCYYGMFDGCSSLEYPPELLSPILANSCYYYMFSRCTSLKRTNLSFPAKTLERYCYAHMFRGCSLLEEAYPMSFTTAGSSSCVNMFRDCTSLVNSPEFSATTINYNCYESMFEGCTSLSSSVSDLPATTTKDYCYYRMFYGCTSLTKSPVIAKSSTLNTACYQYMFYNCSNLSHVTALATGHTSSSQTKNWLYGVAPYGTFVKSVGSKWVSSSVDGIPEGWSTQTI